MSPVIAARYSEVARLTRRTPAAASSATENDFPGIPTMKFTGFDTELHTVRTASRVGNAGREQHVGAGAFVGLQAPDGVVEVGAAMEEVLGARGQRERKGQRACGFGRRGDAFGGQRREENRRVLHARGVFDGAADQADLGGARDGSRRVGGRIAKAFLEIRRHREDRSNRR